MTSPAPGVWTGMTEACYEAHVCVDGEIVERRGAEALKPCPRCPPRPKAVITGIDQEAKSITVEGEGWQRVEIDLWYAEDEP